MTSERADSRRRYSAAMKAQVVAACDEPGASVARVAMAHGINANVVHRWRRLAREGDSTTSAAMTCEFIALPIAASPATTPAPTDIRVELRRGPVSMSITWPSSAAADFAVWTRELLR